MFEAAVSDFYFHDLILINFELELGCILKINKLLPISLLI